MDNKINESTEILGVENIEENETSKKQSDVEIVTADESLSNKHHHHGEHHGSHHHSGHHHHSHHRRRRSSHSKKKNVNTKLILGISIALLLVLLVCVAVIEITDPYKASIGNQPEDEVSSDILSVEVINEDGVLVKDAVSKYLLTDLLNSYNANVTLFDFSNSEGRLDVQVPVGLELSTKEGNAVSYKIELAENEKFDEAAIFYVDGSAVTHEFKHLKTNTEYYYRVTAYTTSGIATVVDSFRTADTPRILSIDGLTNVRDIGNWKTDSGKRIKQGLLLRGTEMDGAVESGYHLTNDGLVDMLEVFGIKTDIDLRAKSPLCKDALGARVEHRYYDMVMYGDIFTDEGKEKVRAVFADLANPDSYPIYLHCTYGCDRTGTICYLLEAVLGVSKGDCLRDYGLSNLNIANIKVVEEGLKLYEGNTLKEQAENYLLSCDVTEHQIKSLRKIFLGD